jgi:hypothetical protein
VVSTCWYTAGNRVRTSSISRASRSMTISPRERDVMSRP